MTLKTKKNETLEVHASPIRLRSEDASRDRAPSHDDIRRRAYEIHLEGADSQAVSLPIGSRPKLSLELPAILRNRAVEDFYSV